MTWKEMIVEGVFKNPFVLMSIFTWATVILVGVILWLKPVKIFGIKFNWNRGRVVQTATHVGCPLSKDIVILFKDMRSTYEKRTELVEQITYIKQHETLKLQMNKAEQTIATMADLLQKNFLKVLRVQQDNKEDLVSNKNYKRWESVTRVFKVRAVEEAKFAMVENHFLDKDERDLREYITEKQEYVLGVMSGVLDQYVPHGFPSREVVYDANMQIVDKFKDRIADIIHDARDIASGQALVIEGLRAQIELIDKENERAIESLFKES